MQSEDGMQGCAGCADEDKDRQTHTHTHTQLDKKNLVIMEEETRHMRGCTRKIRTSQCLKDTKEEHFPHSIVDTWNGLKVEVVTATNINKFKKMFNIWRQDTMSPARTLYNTTR